MIDAILAILFLPATLLLGPLKDSDENRDGKRLLGWAITGLFWWAMWRLFR